MTTQGSFATNKTFVEGTAAVSVKPKKYTKSELPQGVAAKFYYTKDETICHLVKSEKPDNHRVPKYNMQLHILAAGTAHTHPLDRSPERYDKKRGEVIALGRALKAYNENRQHTHVYVASATMSGGYTQSSYPQASSFVR